MPRYHHEPIEPAELRMLLRNSGLDGSDEFAKCTGANERRARRWLSGEQPDPPLWTAMFLLAMQHEPARNAVLEWVEKYVTEDADPTRSDPE